MFGPDWIGGFAANGWSKTHVEVDGVGVPAPQKLPLVAEPETSVLLTTLTGRRVVPFWLSRSLIRMSAWVVAG